MIGDKLWYQGDEVTISSNPYILYGGQFVDAIKENGTTITMPTRAQRVKQAEKINTEWQDQQEQFRGLNNV